MASKLGFINCNNREENPHAPFTWKLRQDVEPTTKEREESQDKFVNIGIGKECEKGQSKVYSEKRYNQKLDLVKHIILPLLNVIYTFKISLSEFKEKYKILCFILPFNHNYYKHFEHLYRFLCTERFLRCYMHAIL